MTSDNLKLENFRYCRSNVDLFRTVARFVQSFKSARRHTNLATTAGGGTMSPPAESAVVDEMMMFMLNNPSLVPREVLPDVPNSSLIETKSWFVNFAADTFVKTEVSVILSTPVKSESSTPTPVEAEPNSPQISSIGRKRRREPAAKNTVQLLPGCETNPICISDDDEDDEQHTQGVLRI